MRLHGDFMISEEKIALMTRLSAFEQEHERELEMKKKYKKRDYVSLKMFQCFIMSSLAYMLVLAGVVYAHDLSGTVAAAEWLELGKKALAFYGIYLVLMLIIVFIHARWRYDAITSTVSGYKKQIKHLHDFYSRDDKQQTMDLSHLSAAIDAGEDDNIDNNTGI